MAVISSYVLSLQNYGGIFGNGSGGAVTFDGVTTVLGLVPSSNVYTMTADIQCTSITINNGVTLKSTNWRIFCQGTVTNNGTIANAGNNAVGSAAGGLVGGGTLGGPRAGGAGGTGVSGAGANGSNANMGGAAGAGGAGTSGAAGTGGTTNISAAQVQADILPTPYPILAGVTNFNLTSQVLQFGPGGGGGGSDASSNAGGGGGGGGGIVALFAWAVNNANGTISAAGGSGAAGAAGNAGGGGGGSGGLIIAYTLAAWTAGTMSVAAGAFGAGVGTGSNGSPGAAGLILNVIIR